MMTSVFFFLVPMIFLSGFIFPIENMPAPIQWVTTVIPLRYFLVIVRGIFLKGLDFQVLWPQFAALGAWGVAVFALAAVRARKGNPASIAPVLPVGKPFHQKLLLKFVS
jgi:ABC-2 type transport system permease protein